MTNVYSLNNDDEVMFDQASIWIARMDRSLTELEQAEFKAWLSENAQHQKLIIEMASMWDKMDSLDRLADLFPASNKIESKAKSAAKTASTITAWPLALAASLVLALFVAFFTEISLSSLWQEEQQFVRYETAVGESSTIYLSDNSKVLLNTDSVLLVRYTDDYRLLDLQRGELHVEVAHDKSRPLSVVANHKVIQAVGTAFSVQVKASEIELIVTEGKVIIGQLNKMQEVNETALVIPSSSLAVSKGEMASLAIANTGIDTVSVINKKFIKKNLSWRHGNLVFNGETLAEAMAEVSRYTSVTFEIADEDLKKIKIAGRFKTGDVKGLIAVLNNNFNIKTDRVNKGLVVLRKQT
jgi:transmembrane sensor